MPEMDGFEVLEQIPRERLPAIVFTTAYDAYAHLKSRAFEQGWWRAQVDNEVADRLARSGAVTELGAGNSSALFRHQLLHEFETLAGKFRMNAG